MVASDSTIFPPLALAAEFIVDVSVAHLPLHVCGLPSGSNAQACRIRAGLHAGNGVVLQCCKGSSSWLFVCETECGTMITLVRLT